MTKTRITPQNVVAFFSWVAAIAFILFAFAAAFAFTSMNVSLLVIAVILSFVSGGLTCFYFMLKQGAKFAKQNGVVLE